MCKATGSAAIGCNDASDLFSSDLAALINAYVFHSQVVNFERSHAEKLSNYASTLTGLIRDENMHQLST